MSVLTKVFVVLLTVFSIALSMLVVAGFARQEDWRAAADDYRAKAEAESANARIVTQNASVEQQRALARHQEDLDTIKELNAQRVASEAKLAELERKLAEAESKFTIEQGQVTTVSDQNKLLQAAFNREKEFSARLAATNSDLQRRNIDLNDRVKELTVSLSMASSQIKALKQQIAAVETAGGEAITQVPGGSNVVEAGTPSVSMPSIPPSLTPIRGEIKSVKGELASISVGNADGVVPGMVFLVYRRGGEGAKPTYLGSIRITRVEATEAAGLIEQSTSDLRVGDQVRDETSFARRG